VFPDGGAVLRCNPDGTELEVYATGLRNPQELAFDEYGNLFTGDNNSDSGDKARWVDVVEGGDSGWRIGFQYIEAPVSRGPWNAEKMWHPQTDGQPAFIVPPVANVADGPSGLTHYPGVGLPDRYQGHFFLADFRGGGFGDSGIRSFANKPKGASFELVDLHQFIWGVLATDVDFGTDCAVYLTDWVNGWDKPNKGRIYKVALADLAKDATAQEVKKLLADGFDQRPDDELAKLLGHADQRVRQEAQFALADRGAKAIPTLTKAATEGKGLARLHGVWGLGQVGRKEAEAYKALLPLTGDADAQVRGQAAKVLGEGKVAAAFDRLVPLLKDDEPRVRMNAAIALGKLKKPEAIAPVADLLRDNADKDPYLRHAGVMALLGCADDQAVTKLGDDQAPAVRLAALLVLRRREKPEVARFLGDADPRLVLEAARAVNDLPLTEGLPKLAALIDRPGLSEPLGYRVLNAHFRLGKPENAKALGAFASRKDAPESLRLEAVKMLGDWAKPSGRDRVTGLYRALEPRPADAAAEAVKANLGAIFSGPDKVRQEAAKVAGKFGIKEVGPVLFETVADKKAAAQTRVETLRALESLKDERLEKATTIALEDEEPRLRAEGRRLLALRDPAAGLAALEAALEKGETVERQAALLTLGDLKGPEADVQLGKWLDRLLAGTVPAELQLELLEAAGKRQAGDVKKKLAEFEKARPAQPTVKRYQEAQAGGDAEAGRRVFLHKAEVSCLRCHKVKGEGGEVGPDLTGIGSKQTREYLLESIVDPNKQIAKGFETVILTLNSGKSVTGIVKLENAREVQLITPEGKLVTVAKADIDERNAGKSPMPEDVSKSLTRREIRDLVEFLAGLKEK
jgi:quinoprotein glucose dehydrogenase